ncbi:dynein axonemal heavy chain 2 isoform X2 [Onthophagus taurus]|uniref:dynein axonemal heavy chain 2 isoform X2 n=1 Tax=Onthophagus taurus TaxID=166361 RepID=UPI0039BE64D8
MASPDEQQPEEKDSLFSDEEPTVTEAEAVTAVEEDVKPEYTEEDLEKLVRFVKDITTLYDLRDTDWNEANEDVIRQWFLNIKEPVLCIYFEADDLKCMYGYPDCPVLDLTYFLREPNEIFDVETFHDKITFATVDDNIEGTILKTLENVYAPVFFHVTTWPDSVKSDFCAKLHMLLAKLTDLYYKLLGLTVIYVPKEGLDIPVEVASKDKELVKRLESIVVYWTRQIRVVIQDQDQNAPDDLLCPNDEYEFWIYRYENLSGLAYQLTNKDLKHTCDILAAVQSIYAKQFISLSEEINQNLIEAKSNIEYLQVLKKPCNDLRKLESPELIPPKLQIILHLIRFIWIESPYYNTVEKITTICRALTNQIILQCTTYLDLSIVFKERRTRQAIDMFQTCIETCIKYIQIYTLVSECHTKHTELPWDLDKAPIFNHLDSYIQRCKDMIEICEAMITFGRFDEIEVIPKPKFGGSRGEEFEMWCEKIEAMLLESIEDVEAVQHLILNVQTSAWYDEILKFRGRMKDIEIVIENLVNSVFEQITTVEDGVEAMGAFFNYIHRDTLKGLFERKTLFIYHIFRAEIQNTKLDLVEEMEDYPARFPYYAGRAMMVECKKSNLKIMRKILDAAAWLPSCSIADEVFMQYDHLMSSIDELRISIYRSFVSSLGDDVLARLNVTLMCRSVTKPGLIECNVDRVIINTIFELKCWLNMGYEVPPHVVPLAKREETIRFIYENVLSVVMDYNKIITSLSETERLLFKQLLYSLEKKIAPGLSQLTWATDVCDEYIAECSACTSDLQEFLDDYKTCNLKIVSICERICDTPMINLQISQAMQLSQLVEDMHLYRNKVIEELVVHYQDIARYIIVVYEGFESHIANMADEWIKYMCRFDHLLEEAVKVCVRNSLQNMYEALHGDGTTGPNSVLKLEANLKQNRINFEPSLSDVAYFVSDILPSITNTLCSLPRLVDKFQIQIDFLKPFHQLIDEDLECQRLQAALNEEVRINVRLIQQYMVTWEPFKELWEVNKEMFLNRYESQKPGAAQFDSDIGRYTEVINNIQMQETMTAVHFILVDSSELKREISEHCLDWQRKLCALLYKMTVDKINHVFLYTKKNGKLIMHRPENLDEMQYSVVFFQQLSDEVPIEAAQFPVIADQITVLDKYKVEIPKQVLEDEKQIPIVWADYVTLLEDADKMIGYAKDEFRAGLLEAAEEFKKEGATMLENFMAQGPFSSEWTATQALSFLDDMRAQISAMRDKEAQLRKDLGLFDLSLFSSAELAALEKELAALQGVWEAAREWDIAWEKYKGGGFWTIETEEMEVTAQGLFRKLTRMSREFKDKGWTIVDDTRARVDAFRRTLPLVSDLKNPSMRKRHWDKVRKVIGQDFDEQSPSFNLEAIVRMRMQDFADEINDISNAATMELNIEKGIKAIEDLWKTMTIDMAPYKDKGVCRIKSVDDCFQALEDNATQISTMKSTRFVEPFAKEVDYWERLLSYISESLENALNAQRQWLYLENIFTGEDIRKQLPKESEDFIRITKKWIEITSAMYNAPTAVAACTFRPPPYLLNQVIKMNDLLEQIQRALEKYLETKRHVFPRFYFISNDDMLEILGNAKKPEAVQPHLKKLFDNMNKIKLQKNITSGKSEAAGMFADDGEYMEFPKFVTIDGPAENWLRDLETAMRNTLRTEFKPCKSSLKKMLTKRDKWLLSNCGQLCNACSLIQWTSVCTRALIHCKILESKKPLKRLRKKQNKVLAKLSELSRKDLPKIQRLKTNALITIEIHSRDVIDRMYKANCTDTNAFEWFSQLRFYWDREIDDCVVRQTNTRFMYGYEYNGNSGRLVITPLTDRCYITLTTALHLFRGGSPKGPAGTGKTETVKDLGKAMGMWVIVNNCSEGLDFKSMGKCFSGLAQTGAWGCFDEFNRINIEVLSVVAQQILCVLSAMSQRLTKFTFEGTEIGLKDTCGIFITMNPGYAGRTELPDNLKSMFRPISMMVPDSSIIAENILFSDGFQSTRSLAKKVFTLYQLAMRQLSRQDHYDFGLRSMVALLRYAGKKRRLHSNFPEDQVVYLAMADMNIAKLTSDDLPLFNGVMSDIFPGVTLPEVDYEEMITAIEESFRSVGLQTIKSGVIKVIQLYETKGSRHSVMILGATGTAKSVTWSALKDTKGRMKQKNKPGFQAVQVYPINPKALNLGELYGEYNLSTNEWHDGIISAIMRITCAEETPDEKWILFDGPVDAVWIENMNSVMDDNKVLTLINSDRITMPEQVSLLFEVGDLTVASPATVSRCGMVYNDYKDWGWHPYVKSWIQRQKQGTKYQDVMQKYFNTYLQIMLDFKRLQCIETVVTTELSIVQALCRLLEIFATRENGIDPTNDEQFDEMSKLWFLFCLVWSVACTVNEDGRKKMDTYIREKEGIFPLKDTIYEYYVEPKLKAFCSWEERLTLGWKYETGIPFFRIIVPTIDTVRYQYIVGNLLKRNYAALLCGPVGTGKTSTAQSVLNDLDPDRYLQLNINMSAQTTSLNVQDAIEGRVEKRTKSKFAPPAGKLLVAYMDDLNMPAKETYGSQPPLELLRQWMDYGFVYDRAKQIRKYIENMLILASMGPPGGGRNVISPRLLSRFSVINMTFPTNETIVRIFGTMLAQHLGDFSEDVKRIGSIITDMTIDLYEMVVLKMLPTPTKTHYLFNLRDISKIFQGMLRAHKDLVNTKPLALRLWIHESFRVFYDRLVDNKDREWYNEQINTQLGRYFELTFHALCPNREIPMFADFVNPFGLYEDCRDPVALRKYLDTQMEEYNVSPGVVRMDLVLFRDAMDHICRIVRVISQPRGNMLLVGIGGSGRQSLSRIAAYICEYSTFQITVTRSYKVVEFREDLKKLYGMTGVDVKPQSFLFNDTQVMEESFLEIINNMLSSGEVANLYKTDEFDEIKNKLFSAVVKNNIPQTNECIYNFFIDRVRANLHIILCMSPIGEAFRNRLRQYPALVNCSTIDWFCDWPKEALLEVANKYINDVNFVETITGDKAVKRKESVLVSSQDKLRTSMAATFATIHASVAQYAIKMAEELKRHTYVTPVNYIELVAGYKKMLAAKRFEVSSQANKLRNGLWKIDDCKDKVQVMSVELAEATVKVVEFQQQCDEYLVIIVNQQKEADEQAKDVAKTSEKIAEDTVQCKKLADVAQADLDLAMPALNDAIAALDALNKKDISEMKSYAKPPAKVKIVMEAVMILKGVDTSWDEAKRQLGDNNFLNDLREFDKNHVTDKTLKKIAVYTTNEEFVPDKIGAVSLAAKSLCLWVIAIEKYAKVYKIVAPKQAKLDEAMESLKEKQRLLAEAQAKLAEIQAMLARLEQEYQEKLRQKEELDRKAKMLQLKLERAAMLVDNLASERDRWNITVQTLDTLYDYLPGDCVMGVGFISYVGAFTSNYREELVELWKNEVQTQEIPFNPTFNIIGFLSDPTSIREWNIQGLPSDAFSTENGIIAVRGTRWPLAIDPQCQASKWIKNMEAKNDLKVIDFGMPDFMRYVEQAVVFGKPILLQNIMESMDPSLNPILDRAVVKQGGMNIIKLDDKMVTYDDRFRFFISTKLTNPHYPPEISTKTTLINFSVKQQGLEAQLLGIVVRKERPQLEEQKDNLVMTIATGKRTLINLENELLRLLNESRGSLLDDAELFQTLQTSKATSIAVQSSLQISETTEVQIDTAREGYRPCAERAAILFFVLNDMGKIDPMYQFALDSYILLFNQSIEKSTKSQILADRITGLNEYHTYSVYKNTCRAIFERHKLLFSFHMCIKILEAQGKIVVGEYNFLLKGGVVLDRSNQMDNPCAQWLSDTAWDNVTELDKLGGFHGVIDSFEQLPRDWYLWYTNPEPEVLPLAGEWEEVCNEFQKMLFIRALRQDRIAFCTSSFIVNQLGE